MTSTAQGSYWSIDSFNQNISNNVLLESKECKKRKEFYDVTLPDILYKHPYKCHTRVRFLNGFKRPEDLSIQLRLVFEDMSSVPEGKKPHIEIKEDRKGQIAIQKTDEKIELRSFWLNCTTYQSKGRKFRLIVELVHENNKQVAVRFTSQPFIIRAKKPIVKKGSRGEKRKRKTNSSNAKKDSGVKRRKTDSQPVQKPEPAPLACPSTPPELNSPPLTFATPPTPDSKTCCPPQPRQQQQNCQFGDVTKLPEKKLPPVTIPSMNPYAFLNNVQDVQPQMIPTSFEYEQNPEFFKSRLQQQALADNNCVAMDFAAPPRQQPVSEAFKELENLLSDPASATSDLVFDPFEQTEYDDLFSF